MDEMEPQETSPETTPTDNSQERAAGVLLRAKQMEAKLKEKEAELYRRAGVPLPKEPPPPIQPTSPDSGSLIVEPPITSSATPIPEQQPEIDSKIKIENVETGERENNLDELTGKWIKINETDKTGHAGKTGYVRSCKDGRVQICLVSDAGEKNPGKKIITTILLSTDDFRNRATVTDSDQNLLNEKIPTLDRAGKEEELKWLEEHQDKLGQFAIREGQKVENIHYQLIPPGEYLLDIDGINTKNNTIRFLDTNKLSDENAEEAKKITFYLPWFLKHRDQFIEKLPEEKPKEKNEKVIEETGKIETVEPETNPEAGNKFWETNLPKNRPKEKTEPSGTKSKKQAINETFKKLIEEKQK